MWMNPFPPSDDAEWATGGAPAWQSAHEMADLFRPTVCASTPDVSKGRATVANAKRILFSAPLYVYASALDELTKSSFPGTLDLVAGHAAVYGWYLAMFEALNASGDAADEWVWARWQAGLTVSLHAQPSALPDALAAASLEANNELCGWAKVCGDGFPAFSQ